MQPFGAAEIVFLFILALVIFGPKKLPEIGKTIGKGMREFRKATDDLKSNWEEHIRDSESPVHDLKQTISEVKADIAASTSEITEEVTAQVNEVTTEVEASTSLEEKPPASTPQEETKPDAHTH
jgi:sec-independent protein translocase protein TatA